MKQVVLAGAVLLTAAIGAEAADLPAKAFLQGAACALQELERLLRNAWTETYPYAIGV